MRRSQWTVRDMALVAFTTLVVVIAVSCARRRSSAPSRSWRWAHTRAASREPGLRGTADFDGGRRAGDRPRSSPPDRAMAERLVCPHATRGPGHMGWNDRVRGARSGSAPGETGSTSKGQIVPLEFTARFLDRLHEGKLDCGKALDHCELNPSPAARVALAAVRRWDRLPADQERTVGMAHRVESERLRRNVGTLRRIAVMAPLLGLLGTLFALGRALEAIPAVPASPSIRPRRQPYR